MWATRTRSSSPTLNLSQIIKIPGGQVGSETRYYPDTSPLLHNGNLSRGEFCAHNKLSSLNIIWMCCVFADIMLQMGFSQEEIQDSLVNQKYNDVMATYLLLDYRNSEVHCFLPT